MDRTGIRIGELRRLSACREVIRAWRALTGGSGSRDTERRTLVACSGGGDSSALVLALAGRGASVVVGHVVHDMRGVSESLTDRDRTASLAEACGLSFVQTAVAVRGRAGNAEEVARQARYRALERLAGEMGCRYVATAHQADDALETLLMRLLRGAGPGGLRGVAPSRPLGRVTLIRPMLGLTSEQARGICDAAGWRWSEDATNRDLSRLRASVRARVAPAIREIEPLAGVRAVRTAAILGEVADLLRGLAEALLSRAEATPDAVRWVRSDLVASPAVVVAEAIRLAAARVVGSARADRRGWASLRRVTECIRGEVHNRKVFEFGGVRIEVKGTAVHLHRTEPGPSDR